MSIAIASNQSLTPGTDTRHSAVDTSPLVAADALVFADLPTRPGCEATTRFADDVWDFGPAITQPTGRDASTVNFGDLPASVRVSLKEYVWLRLHRGVGVHGTVKPATVKGEIMRLLSLARHVIEHFGVTRLSDITQDHLARHLEWLRTVKKNTPETLKLWVADAQRLAAASGALTGDHLCFLPWGGVSASKVTGARIGGDGVTPEVPEPVLRPLLAWAEQYVVHWADEIVSSATRDSQPLEAWRVIEHAGSKRRDSQAARFHAYAECLRERGCGFPTGRPRHKTRLWYDVGFHAARHPLRKHIALDVMMRQMGYGAHWNYTGLRWDGWATLLDELGTDVDVARAEAVATGRPSLLAVRGLGLELNAGIEETAHLQAACFILNAYYSVMRVSEIQSEMPGCAVFGETPDGLVTLPLVRSVLHKWRDAGGDVEEWQVHEIVHDAVRALERLRVAHAAPDTAPLYYNVQPGLGRFGPWGAARVAEKLNDFRDHVNALAPNITLLAQQVRAMQLEAGVEGGAAPLDIGPVPLHDGEPWELAPHQLRVSMLRRIAAAPGGVIAGAYQAKHSDVATLRSYSQTAANTLLREQEAAHAVAALDVFEELYDHHQAGVRFPGKKGAEVHRELQAVADEVGARVVTRAELREMLRSRLRDVHAGPLNLCFYDPDRALCRQYSTGDEKDEGPLIAACRSGVCGNALHTQDNLPAWEWQEREAERLIQITPRQYKAQIAVLSADRDEARRIQNEIRAGLPPVQES